MVEKHMKENISQITLEIAMDFEITPVHKQSIFKGCSSCACLLLGRCPRGRNCSRGELSYLPSFIHSEICNLGNSHTHIQFLLLTNQDILLEENSIVT